MRKFMVILTAVLSAVLVVSLGFAQVKIGDVRPINISTLHPYPRGGPGAQLVWSYTLQHPGATFIKVHFSTFDVRGTIEGGMPTGDFVVVRDSSGSVTHLLSGSYPEGVWALSVPGESAVLELYATSAQTAYGFDVDKYAFGTEPAPIPEGGVSPGGQQPQLGVGDGLSTTACSGQQPQLGVLGGPTTTACGGEDRTKICEATVPARIGIAKPVGSLMFVDDCGRGVFTCTGFLFQQRDEPPVPGAFMTNAHCANSRTECNSMEVAFNYICDGDPAGPCSLGGRGNPDIFHCKQFVQTSCPLDFAIHILAPDARGNSPTAIYGALTLNPAVPAAGQTLWIPQHPGLGGVGPPPQDLAACVGNTNPAFGRTKEISEVGCVAGPAPIPVGGLNTCSDPPACPNNLPLSPPIPTGVLSDLPHQCDTEAGASGSPVIDAATNTVVALHHTGGCPPSGNAAFNQSVLMANIIPAKIDLAADLGIHMTDSPDPVRVGGELTYRLRVRNNGPLTATGVEIIDTLAENVNFVSASSGCSRSGRTVACEIGDLRDGETAVRLIRVRPTAPGKVNNTAMVTANEPDLRPGDNTATTVTTVK